MKWLTLPEVAARLGLTIHAAKAAVQRGDLQIGADGRVSPTSVVRLAGQLQRARLQVRPPALPQVLGNPGLPLSSGGVPEWQRQQIFEYEREQEEKARRRGQADFGI